MSTPPRWLRSSACLFAICGSLLCAFSSATLDGQSSAARATTETRAIWVTRATLTTPTAIAEMVRTAKASGFNTLIVQVRGRGDAYYRSSIEPRAAELASRPDFDPLAETLELAHRAGLRVHAWLAVNLVSSAFELPASRQHLVYRQPDSLMVPRELAGELLTIDPRSPEYVGRIARWTRTHSAEVEGLFTSPTHPAVTAHLVAVVNEIAQRYPVDGIHLDYARYPNANFDFSRTTLQQFKQTIRTEISDEQRRAADAREAIDPLAYPNMFVARWQGFLRSRMTSLVMRLRTVAKAARPDIVISAAVIPDLAQAHDARFQDWRTWLDLSIIDVLCPMAYTQELDLFEKQIAAAQEVAGGRPVWAGVGAYRLTTAATLEHIAAARRQKAAGVILFSYDSLITPPNSAQSLAQLGRAAFAGEN
jgi:uncharacterized lipoprotein YddW (UPF0748 family)